MDKKINVQLSYSWSEKNEMAIRFIEDLHKLSTCEISDGNKDFNAGNDYFNLLQGGLIEADYFIRVLSDEIISTGNLELRVDETQLIEGHNLKILQVNFNKAISTKLKETSPNAIIIDFTRDYDSAFKELLSYVNDQTNQNLIYFPLSEIYKGKTIAQVTNSINQQMIVDLAANPYKMRSMNPFKFEEMVAELYDAFGYAVSLTSRSHDGGIDIFAVKATEKLVYLIECKRSQNNVGLQTVQKLYGVLKLNHATKAILVTTAHLTKKATHVIETHRWELGKKDYDDLIVMMAGYKQMKKL